MIRRILNVILLGSAALGIPAVVIVLGLFMGSDIFAQRGNILGGGGTAYTLSYLVESGNGLDPALDTSALPNIPRSWRSEALAIVIGATNGMALRGLTDLNNVTGYRSRFDFYLAADAAANDTFCSIAVGKQISALEFHDADTPIAWYIDFYKTTAGERKFRTRIPTMSGELTTTWSGTVQLQKIHRFDNTYDITNENYTLEIDGTTVIDRDFDAAAIPSIDTLVLGSSGGSTCRNVTYLIGRVLENPLGAAPFTVTPPPVPPSLPVLSQDSPANGATQVPIVGQSIGCSSTGALTYDILFGTVNPPVTTVVNDSPTCAYVIPTMANNTTYYARAVPSNADGSTTGAIWSFTTVPVPTVGDLDIVAATAACADSAEDSPTGRNPKLFWTCASQATWNHMVDDYEAAGCVVAAACSATPATLGGRMFKSINAIARTTTVLNDGSGDDGIYNALAYQFTGNAEYVTNPTWGAWKKISDKYLPSTPWPSTDVNVSRVVQGKHVFMLELLWPALTDAQRLEYVAEIDAHNDAGWWNYASGLGRWGDADQTIGQLYFPMAMMKVLLPNNVSNNAIWDDSNQGGFDAEVCTSPLPFALNNNRDGLCIMFDVVSQGGEYLEGPAYAKETIPYAAFYAKAISNARGSDTYPEITEFMEDYVDMQAASYTPDLRKQVQYADESFPDILQQFYVGHTLMAAAGYLKGTDAGRRAKDLLTDMMAVHGEDALQVFAGVTKSKWFHIPMFDPYDSEVDWKTSKFHYSIGQGSQYLKSGYTASDSLFAMHCPEDLAYANGIYATQGYDHEPIYHCAPFWYSNGEWIVQQIASYAGASFMPEGQSVMRFNGFGSAREYQRVRSRSVADTHFFFESTTGGSQFAYTWTGIGKPPVNLNEGTRATLWIPAINATIIHDRASVDDIVDDGTDLQRYPVNANERCSEYGRSPITEKFAKQEWQWHIPVDPTVASNVFTWTTPATKQSVKLTSLLPAVSTKTVYDLNTTFAQNLATGNRCGWRTDMILPSGSASAGYPYYEEDAGGFNRKLLKIWPTTMGTFHTYLHVVQVGASAITPTTMNNGGLECAHVVTTGQNDVMACFNNATSTILGLPYAVGNKTILDSARLAGAGARTIPVTTVAANLEMHFADLNPALSWTYNIDGAGAVAINGAGLTSTGGYARIVVALSAGLHSIVVTGS